jgi:hypothetical protein
MTRLIARLLLVLSMTGILVPLALAAAPQPACCVRKCCKGKAPHTHESSGASVQGPSCCRQNGVPSLTVSNFATLASSLIVAAYACISLLDEKRASRPYHKFFLASHGVRGPPQSVLFAAI